MPGIEPFNLEEHDRASRVASQLHRAWQAWLGGFASADRSASGLSRRLDVDRTTCQRLVYAIRGAFEGAELLGRVPGVPGLSRLLDSSEGVVDAAVHRAARESVEAFAGLIDDLAGSQSRLIRRLDATGHDSDLSGSTQNGDDETAERQKLFESAARLTGRWSDLWMAVYVYVPDAARERMRVPRVYGLLGHRATPEAVPLVVQNFGSVRDGEAGEGGVDAGVISSFSSSPDTLVRDSRTDGMLVQRVDAEPGRAGDPIDLVFGSSMVNPHPRLREPRLENLWALVHFPARAMLLDAYMPVSEARSALPSVGLHLWGPDHDMHAVPSWRTRFPHGPKIQLLGRGLEGVESPLHARHPELTRLAFERAGVDPEAYVGYRLAVPFPMWRAGYCLSFDFDEGELG